ncbi:hypothetical protein M6D81_04715 [Paenibacillus sp. J5C_2022]|uniref:hypothetical protein n=1 Tax=Paenibacillus sp. J5C2022 TaxID=2977129 RepID=UPI0021D25AC7|nr:hypothetical protein [Paenibacillus sp. J5C2022]MCU6708008.1 hypothetical protein [Paenibacillus sp. J5C2022]
MADQTNDASPHAEIIQGNEEIKRVTHQQEPTLAALPIQTELPIADFNSEKKSTPLPSESAYKRHSQKGGKRKFNSGNQANKPKTDEISPGKMLEFRIKRLIFNLGYYPRMDIDMKTSPDDSADKITDLDVYGVYIHKDFTTKTIWADCKSGDVKIHDRLSWIKGIMSTIQINDVLLVANNIRTSVKQHARKSGIQILDMRVLEKLENDFNIRNDDWRGSWNPKTQHNKIVSLAKLAIPTNEPYKKIAGFISSDYWVMDNYSKAKKSITALRDLATVATLPLSGDQLQTVKWAIFELISLVLLAVLNISKELYYFNEAEKKETVYDGLASGDVPNKKRAEIFDAAFRVAYSMVQNQIPEFQAPLKMPTFNLAPPGYSESFFDLVLRITNKPNYYFDILRFIDYILMEHDLTDKVLVASELKAMFSNYDDLVIGAKTVLHTICQITHLPRDMFSLIK